MALRGFVCYDKDDLIDCGKEIPRAVNLPLCSLLEDG